METKMKDWEVARIIEIVSSVLALWSGEFIDVHDGHGNSRGMSIKTFKEMLERELKS